MADRAGSVTEPEFVMKSIIHLIIISLLLIAGAGCDIRKDESPRNRIDSTASSQAPETFGQDRFRVTLVGRIDGKYDIRMDLERTGDKLRGTYSYQRPGASSVAAKYIELNGGIDPEGNVTLTETVYQSGTPVKSGEFKGKLLPDHENDSKRLTFSGTWTRTRDNRSMPFSLAETSQGLSGSLTLTEVRKSDKNKSQRYEMKTSLPRLVGDDKKTVEAFDLAVDNLISDSIQEFRTFVADEAKRTAEDPGLRDSMPPNFLEIDHSVISSNRRYISILFSFHSYTGGAHPNTFTRALNFDLEKRALISLDDLFKPGYLKVVSDYCVAELGKLKIGDADWIGKGAGPDRVNFKSWNIAPEGLMITFDAYQVASYAEGPQEVVVPFAVLKPFTLPGGFLWSAK